MVRKCGFVDEKPGALERLDHELSDDRVVIDDQRPARVSGVDHVGTTYRKALVDEGFAIIPTPASRRPS